MNWFQGTNSASLCSLAWRVGTITLCASHRPARLHRLMESIPWNQFLGSLNVYKFELCCFLFRCVDDDNYAGLLLMITPWMMSCPSYACKVHYTGTGWHGRVLAIIYVHIFTQFPLSFLPRIITDAKNFNFFAFSSIRGKTLLKVVLSKRTLSNPKRLAKGSIGRSKLFKIFIC